MARSVLSIFNTDNCFKLASRCLNYDFVKCQVFLYDLEIAVLVVLVLPIM